MIVVADASPFRYLILIEHVHVLRALHGRVIVPPAVISELNQERTPGLIRNWLSTGLEKSGVKTQSHRRAHQCGNQVRRAKRGTCERKYCLTSIHSRGTSMAGIGSRSASST